MTSILHLAGYAISRRAQLRATNVLSKRNDMVIPCSCSKCLTMRKNATKKRLERNKARGFLVVSHKAIKGSKCAIIVSEDLSDDHNVLGAFHKLSIAKAFKERTNELSDELSRFWRSYTSALNIFGFN